jgi:predicted small secreted protein
MLKRVIEAPATRLLGAAALAAVLTVIAACKTTEGAGEDLENLGENIQDSAED